MEVHHHQGERSERPTLFKLSADTAGNSTHHARRIYNNMCLLSSSRRLKWFFFFFNMPKKSVCILLKMCPFAQWRTVKNEIKPPTPVWPSHTKLGRRVYHDRTQEKLLRTSTWNIGHMGLKAANLEDFSRVCTLTNSDQRIGPNELQAEAGIP